MLNFRRLIVATLALAAFAGDAPIAGTDKRVALVIGNSAYQHTSTLTNSINDAEDLAAVLTRVGFTVILRHNLDKRGMEDAVARFARMAQDADAALFFYAGHGMQYRGSNYLMPVDAKLEDEFKLTFELTRIDDVLFGLERARGVKILILDACRNNPLADRLTQTASSRDLLPTRGLAKIEASRGMVIAYSTQANQVAIDGTGRNSPFTAALVKEINEPGVEIGTLFRRVAANVNLTTRGRQLPELSVSLVGDFYLNTHDTDLQAWTKLKGVTDAGLLKDFISGYPNSPLVSEVQDRLSAIDRADRARIEAAQRAQTERAQAERERVEREQLAKEQAGRNRLTREQAERNHLAQQQVGQEQPEPKSGQPVEPIAETHAPAAASNGTETSDTKTASLTPPAAPVPSPKLSDVLYGSALVAAIKTELRRVGCYFGQVDGNWSTSATKSSVRKFVRYAKLPSTPDDPDGDFLDTIRGKTERVCPLECKAGQIERDGRCVAKRCPMGQRLNDDGDCVGSQRAKSSPDPMETKRSLETSPVPGAVRHSPPAGAVPYGQKTLVDDGSCPRGSIKEITGGNLARGIPRRHRCVARN